MIVGVQQYPRFLQKHSSMLFCPRCMYVSHAGCLHLYKHSQCPVVCRYLTSANFWGLPRSDSTGAGGLAAYAGAAAFAGAAAAAAAFTRATGIEGYTTSAAVPVQQPVNAQLTTQHSLPSSSGASGTSLSGSSRREADFKAAWDLLQRSLACFLRDKAARNGMQLPSAWNPVAWLAVYCAVVKRDSRQDSKLVAASFKAADSAAVGSSVDGTVGLRDGTMSTSDGYAGLGADAAAAGARWSGEVVQSCVDRWCLFA